MSTPSPRCAIAGLASLAMLIASPVQAAAAPPAANPRPAPAAAAPASAAGPSRLQAYALRLRPGDDLKRALVAFARANKLQAGAIVTCVGSLREARLRLADRPDATTFQGKFEIVSLVGTLTEAGAHLHLAIADGQGRTVGGHLVDGCSIYTTAEIVVGELAELSFRRAPDPVTTYQELEIGPRATP